MKAMVNEKPRVRRTRRTVRARPAASLNTRQTEVSSAEERQVAEIVRTFTVRWEW